MNRLLGIVAFGLCFSLLAKADEGMWLPMHLKRLNHVDMQEKGLQLSAEELYNINGSSLKDAIVSLGGFCTGEIISDKGLMLTNHHCAFGAIQEISSVENDYLTDGFWAMSNEEERPIDGLTASFLVRMEDVTDDIFKMVSDTMTEKERSAAIGEMQDSLVKMATSDTTKDYNARVKSFFKGNEYYLFIYETFKDVRLVGAPPSSIGKYGGDTDNWMWPRHTGDFALFRVYSDTLGMPAKYDSLNVPLKPKHFLPVSTAGVKAADFAMIMGFPGSTDRYLTSYGVKHAIEKEQPSRVKIREQRLAIMKAEMNADPAVRIKYASKYASVSNYYKYFKGQTRGLKRLKVYDKKVGIENDFVGWAEKNPERKEQYGNVIPDISKNHELLDGTMLARPYFNETVFSTECLLLSYRFGKLQQGLTGDITFGFDIKDFKKLSADYFKDYNSAIDRRVLESSLRFFTEDLPAEFQPDIMEGINKKYKGDLGRYADFVFAKSIFTSEERMNDFLNKPNGKTISKDPAFLLMGSFLSKYRKISADSKKQYSELNVALRLFVDGLRQIYPDKKFYPDANSTMRLTYGQVLDYDPADAVSFDYYTTLKGVFEKEDPTSDEFIVPAKLKELYENKDYGEYGEDGVMKVCFITNNDITGGNSGSPVINGRGELIGCAFDGNWEAMSGDIAFEHVLQRTIAVDVRYILFIIDKYAGATRLIDEMKLVNSSEVKTELTKESEDKEKEYQSSSAQISKEDTQRLPNPLKFDKQKIQKDLKKKKNQVNKGKIEKKM